MSTNPEGITNPPIDDLLDKVDSKYRLVIFAAKRARQINAYYSQLGEGLLENVGPLVGVAPQEKPLSVALRELQGDLLQYTQVRRPRPQSAPPPSPTRLSPSWTRSRSLTPIPPPDPHKLFEKEQP